MKSKPTDKSIPPQAAAPERLADLREKLTHEWTQRLGDPKKVKNKLSALMTALNSAGLEFLHRTHPPDSGYRGMRDIWQIKVADIADLEAFNAYVEAHKGEHPKEYWSHIRGLIGFIHQQVLPKTAKYPVYDTDLNAALEAFKKNGDGAKSSRKQTASALREVLHHAGVKTLAELLSEAGQRAVVEAQVKGKVSDHLSNKARRAAHWVIVKNGGTPVAGLIPEPMETIWELSPDIDRFVMDAWERLKRAERATGKAKHFKGLWRHLARSIHAKSLKELRALKPSDYVLAFYEAQVRGNGLQPFHYTKRLFESIIKLPVDDERWLLAHETFDDFKKRVTAAQRRHPGLVYRDFDLHQFEHAFTEQGAVWRLFDEVFRDIFTSVVKRYSEKKRTYPNHLTEAGHYQTFQEHFFHEFYGEKCANRKTHTYFLSDGTPYTENAVRGPDRVFRIGGWAAKPDEHFTEADLRMIRVHVPMALQVTTPTRFFSEMGPLVYLEKTPPFTPGTPNCIFYWEEKKAWALFLNIEHRKNKQPTVQSYNDLVDAMIGKYVRLLKLKSGDPFIQCGLSGIKNELKRLSVEIVGAFSTLDEVCAGSAVRALTPHRFRSVLTKVIQFRYTGSDKDELVAAALGEKPKLKEGESRMSDVYGAVIRHSMTNFDKIRRIKNGIYKSDIEIRFDEQAALIEKQTVLIESLMPLVAEIHKDQTHTKGAVNQIGNGMLQKLMQLYEENADLRESAAAHQTSTPEPIESLAPELKALPEPEDGVAE